LPAVEVLVLSKVEARLSVDALLLLAGEEEEDSIASMELDVTVLDTALVALTVVLPTVEVELSVAPLLLLVEEGDATGVTELDVTIADTTVVASTIVEVLILATVEAELDVDGILLLVGDAEEATGVTEVDILVLDIAVIGLPVVKGLVLPTDEAELDVDALLLILEEEDKDTTGVTEGDADTMEAAVVITFDTEVATTWAVELMLILVIVEVCLFILS